MDENAIFKEILKSSELKKLLGVPESESINEDYDSSSQRVELNIVRSIIAGQVNHTSDDALFKNIQKLYDL